MASTTRSAPTRDDLREVSIEVPVDPERAWAVVADPRTYPRWLVGAVEILSVDDAWPAEGTEFRHRVGVAGPLTTQDSTKVLHADEPRLLILEAKARPFGRAHVEIEVRPAPGGAEIAMREGLMAPLTLLTGPSQPLVMARNRKSLANLRDLPEVGAP